MNPYILSALENLAARNSRLREIYQILTNASVHDKKIIEHTTTDYYKLGLEGLVAVLKSLSTVVFWMS